jgi:hypothetical protein
MKVDVVIPSRTGTVRQELLTTLRTAKWTNNITITQQYPVSEARRQAVANATTEWVAMIDDDMTVPDDWIEPFEASLKPIIGAVSSVAYQTSKPELAYTRVVKCFRGLDKIDTVPYTNNMLIRRELMGNGYKAHGSFYGEDQHLRRHVESMGYRWLVLPFHGAVHHGKAHDLLESGVAFSQGKCYSFKQMARRVLARFILIPYAALTSLSFKVLVSLTGDNVKFLAGWLKAK